MCLLQHNYIFNLRTMNRAEKGRWNRAVSRERERERERKRERECRSFPRRFNSCRVWAKRKAREGVGLRSVSWSFHWPGKRMNYKIQYNCITTVQIFFTLHITYNTKFSFVSHTPGCATVIKVFGCVVKSYVLPTLPQLHWIWRETLINGELWVMSKWSFVDYLMLSSSK